MTVRLPVLLLDAAQAARAAELARQLDTSVVESTDADWRAMTDFEFVLLLDEAGLALASPAQPRMLPVRVDFDDPALLRRLQGPGSRKQELVRASGVADHRGVAVVDLTAGWGRDAAVLASHGSDVLMIERNPVVAALLDDGLQRARCSADEYVRTLAARLSLAVGDAATLLPALAPGGDFVVTIDPMFPQRQKSAAVAKEMQFFHQLVGADEDADRLLEAALASGAARVIVKRPRKAPVLASRQPTRQVIGKVTRFDIYAIRALKN